MRLLITAFEPFGGETINPSQEAIKDLTCDEFGDVEIAKETLPVSFERSKKAICELIDKVNPDTVIMFGLSGKSNCIKIERVALNLMDSNKADNDGYNPCEVTIYPDAPSAYLSQLPIKKIQESLNEIGISTMISNSAGLYVCNTTYFAALHHIATTDKNANAVFVHLPKISVEWPVEKMKATVKQLITTLKDNL